MDWGDWGCLTPIILQPACINQTNLAHLTVYRPCKHQSTSKKRLEWQIRQTSSCHFFSQYGSTRAITAVSLFPVVDWWVAINVHSAWGSSVIVKRGFHGKVLGKSASLKMTTQYIWVVLINTWSLEFPNLPQESWIWIRSFLSVNFPRTDWNPTNEITTIF